MSIPQISQQLRDTLTARGYDSTAAYEINRLPSFAIPRTVAYNLTTAGLVGLSLAGLIYTKRKGLSYQGFAIALGLTFALDYMQRRQIDKTSFDSERSSGSFEHEIEKFPEFKKAYLTVSREIDDKIAELEGTKPKFI